MSSAMHKQNKIKRSDLVDQLRDHQVRSKFNWASVSYFSSNANPPPSYSRYRFSFRLIHMVLVPFYWCNLVNLLVYKDGHDDVCTMGTFDPSFYCFFGRFIIFNTLEAHYNPSYHHIGTALMFEDNQASKIEQEKQAKNASSFINVETFHLRYANFNHSLPYPDLFLPG
ncbi:hypothetical protein OSB04_028552 [Centaurea solstitialis]|uniref:Uncharacterized protein n=1 Tax=Centaurea solstitialis TaxID=347529 RepID=A0AA38WBA2_9ASTR|nr:hypothetical protein OSB04_028552 [Centaurea solstitialis]